MMNKYTNLIIRQRNGYLLMLLSLVLVSLACNLPFLGQSGEDDADDLNDKLVLSGLLFVDEIYTEAGIVTIQYQILPEDSPEVMVSGWMNALIAAAEAHPDATTYVLDTTSGGDPFLEIRAEGLDARGFAAGEIAFDLFLERLEILDRRSLEDRISSELLEMGYELIEVSETPDSLLVSYYAASAQSEAEMVEQWWGIFDQLAQHETSLDRIWVRSVMPDNSAFVVEGDLADLDAYYLGEITALEYLSRLEISQEASEVEATN